MKKTLLALILATVTISACSKKETAFKKACSETMGKNIPMEISKDDLSKMCGCFEEAIKEKGFSNKEIDVYAAAIEKSTNNNPTQTVDYSKLDEEEGEIARKIEAAMQDNTQALTECTTELMEKIINELKEKAEAK